MMNDNIVEQLRQAGYTEQQLYEAGFGENPMKEDSEEDSES